MKTKKTAFTLLEIMIVVICLGVIASLGLSSYQKVYKKSLEENMKRALMFFDGANKIYKAHYGRYWIPSSEIGIASVNVDSLCHGIYGSQNDNTLCSMHQQIWNVLIERKPQVIDDFYQTTNFGQDYRFSAYTQLTTLGPPTIMVADSVKGVCCTGPGCLATPTCP